MHFLDKIVDKLTISLNWRDNQKKVTKQTGQGVQVNQEQNSVTTIIQVGNVVTVNNIEELAGLSSHQDMSSLLNDVGQRFLLEQKIKQENFSNTVSKAHLDAIQRPQEISKDWFLKWMEVSQGISREDIQIILARILAGQVEKKEEFSLRMLDLVKSLSKEELEIFQIFCDISFSSAILGVGEACVICDPFGSPGDNSLNSLGLSYPNLTILQDAGLIQGDLNAWRKFLLPISFQTPFTIGSASMLLQPISENMEPDFNKIKTINFTRAGLEVRSVLTLRNNQEYIDRFLTWAREKWNMTV